MVRHDNGQDVLRCARIPIQLLSILQLHLHISRVLFHAEQVHLLSVPRIIDLKVKVPILFIAIGVCGTDSHHQALRLILVNGQRGNKVKIHRGLVVRVDNVDRNVDMALIQRVIGSDLVVQILPRWYITINLITCDRQLARLSPDIDPFRRVFQGSEILTKV